MSVLLHPTLASRPGAASELARRLGGVWEVKGGYCVLRPTSHFRQVRELIPNFLKLGTPFNPNGPEAA